MVSKAILMVGILLTSTFCASDSLFNGTNEFHEPFSAAFLSSHQGSLDLEKDQSGYAIAKIGSGPVKSFFLMLLFLYQNGISPADGPSCSFQPTCSGYALGSMHSHGVAMGILMTGDRLIRCNGYDKSAYPLIGPERRFYDPVP